MAKKKTYIRHRRSDTGEYCTKKYAEEHPRTTQKEI